MTKKGKNILDVSDDLGLGLPIEMQEEVPAPVAAPATPSAEELLKTELEAAKAREAAVAQKLADLEAKQVATPRRTAAPPAEIDPEDDRENWPTVMIDAEDEKPNFAFLSAHGTKLDGSPFGHELKIMRGVNVKVPPSIVHALNDAVATHFTQVRNPQTGENKLVSSDRASIPWRVVQRGKYI